MANVTQISLESLLLRATNQNNTNLDQAAVEAFFALINKERDGPAIGVKVIAARLPNGTEKEVLSILNILDMCMSKCGISFQNEVGKFRFLNEMIKLVSPKYLGSRTPLSVKQRVLQLLYLWTLDYHKEVKIKEAFEMLRKQGVIREIPNPNIPQEALGFESKKKVTSSIFQDEEKSNILRKLLQSKDPEDIQTANWLIKSMVKEEEKMADLKSKAVTELESVQNNLRLLNEMMGSYKKGVTTSSELDLMKELYDNLVRLTPNLTAIACYTEHCPSDLVESVGKTMNDLTACCTKYKSKILEEKVTFEPHMSHLASLMDLDQQAVCSGTTSLLEMEQREFKSNLEDCSCSSHSGSQTSQISSDTSKSSLDVFCDVFAGLGDISHRSDILQPVAITSNICDKICNDKGKEKNKIDALGDLDILGEQLLKENLPSSNYRPQEKIPMNLMTKINKIKKPEKQAYFTPETESSNLNLGYLLENVSNLSKSEENLIQSDVADDCLVDINEDNVKMDNEKMTENRQPKKEKKNDKGNTANNINLKDIVVELEQIKPSSRKSVMALDETNGLTVLLYLAKDKPRPGVSVYVISTISRNEMALSNYLFQAVVPKGCKLKLQPPSSTDLPAYNPFLPPSAITQIMLLASTEEEINLKFVISYVIDDDTITEMGEVERLPLYTE